MVGAPWAGVTVTTSSSLPAEPSGTCSPSSPWAATVATWPTWGARGRNRCCIHFRRALRHQGSAVQCGAPDGENEDHHPEGPCAQAQDSQRTVVAQAATPHEDLGQVQGQL
ncbi:uncharacterized protein LOC117095264 isoform X3 [Trachypithecus francoisi]|uniref:uncharacterized protein LOC117095264 isoform X3 n=1 Tax=Trachypithecus francoisi TaxID=54180 RepID=UPI00141A7A6D|nr:uncharacterized protein LOC117095264 isoform X3 [Trachypithecus francoisi]